MSFLIKKYKYQKAFPWEPHLTVNTKPKWFFLFFPEPLLLKLKFKDTFPTAVLLLHLPRHSQSICIEEKESGWKTALTGLHSAPHNTDAWALHWSKVSQSLRLSEQNFPEMQRCLQAIGSVLEGRRGRVIVVPLPGLHQGLHWTRAEYWGETQITVV